MIVTLVQPLDLAGGAHFNPGERVHVDDALARDLMARGIAKPEEVLPMPKTLDAPPVHKQIAAPKGKKTAGRA